MTAKSCTLQAAVVMIAIAFVRGAKEDVFVSRNMRQAHHFRRLGTLPAALLVSKKSAVCVCVCVCVRAAGRVPCPSAALERWGAARFASPRGRANIGRNAKWCIFASSPVRRRGFVVTPPPFP